MHYATCGRPALGRRPALVAIAIAAVLAASGQPARCDSLVSLPGHIPAAAIAHSRALGRLTPNSPVTLAISLRIRNQAALEDLLRRLYDANDPLYGRYLTPEQFAARFSPAESDYQAVADYAAANGLTVTATHSNRLVLDVAGPAAAVERAFRVRLIDYQAPDGRRFHAPDREPQVPAAVAARIAGIVGLENAAVWHTHNRPLVPDPLGLMSPRQTGSGPGGGLTPTDIRAAYNLSTVSADGTGQVLGLFELAGYSASDISSYESYYKLPAVPLANVLVDGGSGGGTGADEVTLDIELQIAGAPGASQIRVYEGPNSGTGVIDTYNKIATENLAKEISTSWGLAETSSSSSMLNSENTIFQQMAAQGQSIFAASGDSGAYDNGSTLSVDDPASQPYMVGCGGTTLATNGAGGTWKSEITWNSGSVSGGASGGGVSVVWTIPSWQASVVSNTWASSSKGSTTMRNVPDVALDADPNTGYSVYYRNGWWIYGGTSCAAPLWAAFAARVNQQLAATSSPLLGFANPSLYKVGASSGYSSDFHDVTTGTNLFYPAIVGYDDATGWGSFNGANLLAALTSGATSSPPAAPTNLTATAGNAQVTLSWTGSSGATSYNVLRATTSGKETTLVTGVASTTYTDTSVSNGTTYYYEVEAVNSTGTSGPSNQASATPQASALPAAPTNLVATGAKRKINLSWTQSTSSGVTQNKVYRSATSGGPYSLIATISAATSYSDTGLRRGATYYYVVTAVSLSGESAYSNQASATTR